MILPKVIGFKTSALWPHSKLHHFSKYKDAIRVNEQAFYYSAFCGLLTMLNGI